MAKGYVYINGSPYRDDEVSSQLRSCLHDAIINSFRRTGEKIDKLGLYRQCPHRIVTDTHMTELDKCEYVSSVMAIAPVLRIDREK